MQNSSMDLQEGLQFLKAYRQFVFTDGQTGVNAEGQEAGPVAPWAADCPYDVMSTKWTEFAARPAMDNFPENICEPGKGTGTMAIWDFIMASGSPKCRPMSPDTQWRKLKPVRVPPLNSFWLNEVKQDFALNTKEHIGDCMFDMRTQNGDYLDAAHVLAHYRGFQHTVATCSRVKLHGRLADELIKACGEIALSKLYGVPIDVRSKGGDVPAGLGILVSPSPNIGFDADIPVFRLPVRRNMALIVNRTAAAVLAVAQVGYDPMRIRYPSGQPFFPEDMWAYQPVRIFLAGWESMGWLAMRTTIHPDYTMYNEPGRRADIAASVKDLMPMSSFGNYLAVARAAEFPDYDSRFMQIDDWMQTQDYRMRQLETPPFPCSACAYTACNYDMGLRQPVGVRPTTCKKDSEWGKFLKSFSRACKDIRKARSVAYGQGYRHEMADRNKGYKFITRRARTKIKRRTKW